MGALVADAASMPLHLLYQRDEMKKELQLNKVNINLSKTKTYILLLNQNNVGRQRAMENTCCPT